MKHITFIIALLITWNIQYAQDDNIAIKDTIYTEKTTIIPPRTVKDTLIIETEEQDTVEGKIKKRSIAITIGNKEKDNVRRVRTRWLMLDYGISTYMHKGSLNMPTELKAMDQRLWGSNNWNLHLVHQRIRLHPKNRINLTYGLSFNFHRYRFDSDKTLQANQNQVTFLDNTEDLSFKKNRLNLTYLTAPLYLGFRFKKGKGKAFNLKIGGYAGVLLGASTKQKTSGRRKIKVKDNFNLNQVRYGLMGRIGYGSVELYVKYGLSSFFKENEQGKYDLQPLSFGIAILPF